MENKDPSRIKQWTEEIEGKDAAEIVAWAFSRFGRSRLVLASSLGLEDQVLTWMALRTEPEARVLTLDTGRMFQETYDAMENSASRYGFRYEVLFPDSRDVEAMERTDGPNLFYRSVEGRKRCCEIRKIRPLSAALETADAWICGLRRTQSVTRIGLQPVECDERFGVIKINPLFDWSADQVRRCVEENGIPYNRLFDRGFTSVGCLPCTRAVAKGEDERSGRWWWEAPEKKECGLHSRRLETGGAS